jgi:hypothetical protein
MNVKIGTEALQFPENEYINRIFVAVYSSPAYGSLLSMHSLRREDFDMEV